MNWMVKSKVFVNDQKPDDEAINKFLAEWPDSEPFMMERSPKKTNLYVVTLKVPTDAYHKRVRELAKKQALEEAAEKKRQEAEAAQAIKDRLAQMQAEQEALKKKLSEGK